MSEEGWLILKFTPHERGYMDRICIGKNKIFFAELKSFTGKPKPLQIKQASKLSELGHDVIIYNGKKIYYMGAITNDHQRFLSFSGGKIVERVPADTPNATERKLERGSNAGKIIHELKYDGWKAYITNIEVKDSDYGQFLNIHIDEKDGSDPVILTCSLFKSDIAARFLKCLPYIDPSRETSFSVFPSTSPNGFTSTALVLYQDGKSVKQYWNQDNPRDLPSWEKLGNGDWDNSKERLHLWEWAEKWLAKHKEILQNIIVPAVVQQTSQTMNAPVEKIEAQQNNQSIETEEELPF